MHPRDYDKLCTSDEFPALLSRFVLDGGSLIQRLQWQKKTTFPHLIGLYGPQLKRNMSKVSQLLLMDTQKAQQLNTKHTKEESQIQVLT